MKRLALLALVAACDASAPSDPDAADLRDCGCGTLEVRGPVQLNLTRTGAPLACPIGLGDAMSYQLVGDGDGFTAASPVEVTSSQLTFNIDETDAQISLTDTWGVLELELSFDETGQVTGHGFPTTPGQTCSVMYDVTGSFEP